MSDLGTIVEQMSAALVKGLLPALGFVAGIAFVVVLLARDVGNVRVPGQTMLIFGFTLLGGILGLATANSRLAAVSVLLSVLLSVVSLLLGYRFGEPRLGAARAVMPYCLVAVLVSCLYGLFLGAFVSPRLRELRPKPEKARVRGLGDRKGGRLGRDRRYQRGARGRSFS